MICATRFCATLGPASFARPPHTHPLARTHGVGRGNGIRTDLPCPTPNTQPHVR